MASTLIPNDIYIRIASSFGYPIVTEADLKLSKDFITDTLIKPALVEYFKFFPIIKKDQMTVSGNFEVPFPRPTTFGVVEARFNSNTMSASLPSLNPLINEQNIRISNGGAGNKFGTNNNYGYKQVDIMESFEKQSLVEHSRTNRVEVDDNNRIVSGFTNMQAQLLLAWADYSDTWDNVSFVRQNEVIDLAKANVLQYLGELRTQISAQLPAEMNGEGFLTRAQELREKVETAWKAFSKPIIIRG